SVRQFGERAATNAPVQGTAADISKLAGIDIRRQLTARGWPARMLLQVRAELVFAGRRGHVDETRAMVTELMEDAFERPVPLEVATGVGEHWDECKGGGPGRGPHDRGGNAANDGGAPARRPAVRAGGAVRWRRAGRLRGA